MVTVEVCVFQEQGIKKYRPLVTEKSKDDLITISSDLSKMDFQIKSIWHPIYSQNVL